MSEDNRKNRMPRIVIEPPPKGMHARRVERPLQLNQAEKNGLADFMISHAGVIGAAKEVLLKSGPDDARARLDDAVKALVRHLLGLGVTELGDVNDA
ncbi:MAG: hypothetical protein QOD56_2871 [Gammaproteobacteria bacterium]|jgi:hypothetical protein|nr:hypothetical protein [Gammaproteobacteria bacterium]